MKAIRNLCFIAALLFSVMCVTSLNAQDVQPAAATKPTPEEAKAKADAELRKKATEWVSDLKLNDTEKEKRVVAAISTHLITIRDWNNEHPFTTVPAGINPATGNKLSDLDRQVIANSAMPASVLPIATAWQACREHMPKPRKKASGLPWGSGWFSGIEHPIFWPIRKIVLLMDG